MLNRTRTFLIGKSSDSDSKFLTAIDCEWAVCSLAEILNWLNGCHQDADELQQIAIKTAI